MRRLLPTAIAVIAAAALLAGNGAPADAGNRSESAAPSAPPTLPMTVDPLVRTAVLPAESCCHWVARHSHDRFQGGVVDRCATNDRLLPSTPYGVLTRVFAYRSTPPDHVLLSSARSTIVKFRGEHAALRYYRASTTLGFDCPPRHVEASAPAGGTAVYKVLRASAARTVVADELAERGATTIRRYIDIRPVGRFVTIVDYELGEEIAYRPDLRRVTRIADAQQRRLERRMSIPH
jgi:hypothetical protein